ncbi:hypothetical protein SPRG_15343 [Saprolegnia parasitica CBS 223.65]|uniref:Uncharacterized protein n=1 Tax=Saprolegnia parasitica (strain CBS 223.65) TaxID=695850 RepID=A0A067BNX9_SAPPC|nr:hypothetical protein SPRG_15343 [Saprolegnia parasitica CBS 223.65]KDO18465.1 hypothetical protein SPRG_15343 [Saprolegnia parasitica CBS 223.65]|eukprot:XP_012210825.1 hypothetical protein SPRG_15343 [Saprolegnia parasitica CBS 223.65]
MHIDLSIQPPHSSSPSQYHLLLSEVEDAAYGQYQPPSQPAYNRQPSYNQAGYGKQPAYGYDGDYEQPDSDDGYASGFKKPSKGYGKQPSTGYGYADDNGDYDPTPISDEDRFHRFYDNLKICKAENALESCIISSASRADCMSATRIKQCTSSFITGLCSDLESTTTKEYDNGYVKCSADTCTDAALADSLLVYNKLLRDVNTALDVTPQFDQWSFTTIKLALASTRNHADCVIKGFLNYLDGCATSSELPKRDLLCLDEALNNGKCEWGRETADGWNLAQFLKTYGQVAFNSVVSSMQHRFGVSNERGIDKAITEVLVSVMQESTQLVQTVNTKYDFTNKVTSVDVCAVTLPAYQLDAEEGTDISTVLFHFAKTEQDAFNSLVYGETVYDNRAPDDTTKVNLYDKCEAFFAETKKAFVEGKGKAWTCVPGIAFPTRINDDGDVECMSTDGKNCLSTGEDCEAMITATDDASLNPLTCGADHDAKWGSTGYLDTTHWCNLGRRELGNQGDKCFTYSGYSIFFLESGETQDLTLEAITDAPETCRTASWQEPKSCSSHLTQWQMHVGCCKSYATVLQELQDTWAAKYESRYETDYHYRGYKPTKNAPTDKHYRTLLEEDNLMEEGGYSKAPAKPTVVSPKYDCKNAAYETTILSRAVEVTQDNYFGQLTVRTGEVETTTTNDIENVNKALNEELEEWFHRCTKLHDDYGHEVSKWCLSVHEFWYPKCTATPTDTSVTCPSAIQAWYAAHPDAMALPQPATTYASAHDATTPVYENYDTVYSNHRQHTCYMAASPAYVDVCDSLHVSWDIATVVPIVSTKCFPQSCVLAQLSQCMDIPEPTYMAIGYDYVAEPTDGYNGYRPSSYQRPSSYATYNQYSRATLGMEGPSLTVLMAVGFVAGVVVVAVAQVVLKARNARDNGKGYRLG